MQRRKVLFLALWGVLLALGGGALYFEGRLQLGHGASIAELSESSGVIQYRSREVPIWSYAGKRQSFYENDVVATGDDAHATIRFASGRMLSLGPNTQVLISTSRDHSRTDYVVSLLTGTLATPKRQGKQTAPSRLVVRVDDKEIKVKSRTAVLSVSRPPAAPAIVTVTSGKAEVLDTVKSTVVVVAAGKTQTLAPPPKMALAAKAIPAPTPPPPEPEEEAVEPPPPPPPPPPAPVTAPPPPKVAAVPRHVLPVPKIVFPFAGSQLWAVGSLAKGTTPALNIRLNKPYGDEALAGEAFTIRVARGGDEALARSSDVGNEQQSVPLPPSMLQRFSAPATRNGLSLHRLALQPGAHAGKDEVVGNSPHPLYLASLDDQPARPMTLLLSSVAQKDPSGRWLGDSLTMNDSDAEATINLVSGTDLVRLSSLLAGASQFRIKAQADYAGTGSFVVRDGYIVAGINLKKPTPEKWATLLQALGGDFIYSGSRVALVQGYSRTAQDRDNAFAAGLAKDSFYVLKGKDLIQLESRLMKNNATARNLVEDTAVALFTEPVTVESTR